MSVLAAILTNARRISLDVTGIERGLVERRPEQQRDAILDANQLSLNCHHRTRSTLRIGGAGDHGPRLGNGIDLTFIAGCRSQWHAIIEPSAAIPVTVPRLTLKRRLQRNGMRSPSNGAANFAAGIGQRNKCI